MDTILRDFNCCGRSKNQRLEDLYGSEAMALHSGNPWLQNSDRAVCRGRWQLVNDCTIYHGLVEGTVQVDSYVRKLEGTEKKWDFGEACQELVTLCNAISKRKMQTYERC